LLCKKYNIMTQLLVSIEDASLLRKIQNAISLLKGVSNVEIATNECEILNETTVEAIEASRRGELIYCSDFEEYLEKVK